MDKLQTLIRKLYESSFVRFVFVGGVATGVHYGIYLLLLNLNLNLTLTYIIAFCVSVSCNFLLSSYFTFRIKPTWLRGIKFLSAHLINLANELLLFNLCLFMGASKYYAPLFVFLVAFPINYLMVRFALRGRLLKDKKNSC